MAFYIYSASQNDKTHVLKIVANESDIENLNLGAYTKIEVSESEYNNIRNCTKSIVSYDGSTFTYQDYPLQETAPGKDSWCCYENNQELDNYLNVVVGRCNDFLEVPTNASNPLLIIEKALQISVDSKLTFRFPKDNPNLRDMILPILIEKVGTSRIQRRTKSLTVVPEVIIDRSVVITRVMMLCPPLMVGGSVGFYSVSPGQPILIILGAVAGAILGFMIVTNQGR